MRRGQLTRVGVTVAAALLLLTTAQAADLRTDARFTPAKGLISDACLLGNGDVLLAYPDAGYLADYTPDGKLVRHVLREAGLSVAFHPTMLSAAKDDGVLVFDEAEHHVLHVQLDGNFSKGIDLGVLGGTGTLAGGNSSTGRTVPSSATGEAPVPPSGTKPIAAARIGGLSLAADGSLWAMLPERDLLAHFDPKGKQLDAADLSTLPGGGLYARGQVTADGTLYVLDYASGAIYYRGSAGGPARDVAGTAAHPTSGEFHRIRVADPRAGFEALPDVQDFAVLDDGSLLVATTSRQRPLLLLSMETGGGGAPRRVAHPVTLQLGEAQRLCVRASRGRFIVWSPDAPVVYVLSPQ